ncbi:MAG: saccharopine dehydrogenase family protein [Fluviicola sp.]|jgi:saccharopine dehydrogenase-like NADP-dependent oxidoreductase
MKTILLLGAGMSASSLIRYLLQHAEQFNWQLRVVDQSLDLVNRKINGHPRGVALSFNALDRTERWEELKGADLVISMLPARFHVEVAKDCLELKKHLITPSYVAPEMKALDQEVKAAGLLFMNEIGVDPGIDHMSAMQIIDEIRAKGGTITSFKSYCGGLIAPESDNNPWNYKFTWNPRNVVLAGQGIAAQYIDHDQYKYLPYGQLFARLDHIDVEGYGSFDGYANRDSLSYRAVYGLETIPTLYRGTLRRKGYCQAWNVFVQLGMTDDSYALANAENLTARTFLNAFLRFDETKTVEEKFTIFCAQFGVTDIERFRWIDLFDGETVIGFENATPAQLLEKILVKKWVLEPGDKDMLVMVHEFVYELHGTRHEIISSMVNIGEDPTYTSMSNTVGLPVGICAKLMLTGALKDTGVHVPIAAHVYQPILTELQGMGITFNEKHRTLGSC